MMLTELKNTCSKGGHQSQLSCVTQAAQTIRFLVSHTHVGCSQAFLLRMIPCSSKGCCHISLILPVSHQDKRASGAAWEPGVINPSPKPALTLHCQVGRG